jgi:hypothetical protein
VNCNADFSNTPSVRQRIIRTLRQKWFWFLVYIGIKKLKYPAIKKPIPTITAEEIISVQPMK